MIRKNKSLPIEFSIDVLSNQRRTYDKSYGSIQEIYRYTEPPLRGRDLALSDILCAINVVRLLKLRFPARRPFCR